MIWPFRRKKKSEPKVSDVVEAGIETFNRRYFEGKKAFERCTADAELLKPKSNPQPSRSYRSIITTNDYVENGDSSSSLATGIAIGMAIESAIDSSSSSSSDTGSFSGDGGSFGGGGSDSSF